MVTFGGCLKYVGWEWCVSGCSEWYGLVLVRRGLRPNDWRMIFEGVGHRKNMSGMVYVLGVYEKLCYMLVRALVGGLGGCVVSDTLLASCAQRW